MIRFYGKASGKVDDKGRIVFPAVFRDAMARSGSEEMTLIIKKSVHGGCLDLYAMEEWEKRSDKVLESLDPELNPGHAAFWAKYNDDVYTVIPDGKLGRLNIPEELLKAAGITKDVVFAGVGYKIQIWDKATREQGLLSDDEFKMTATTLSRMTR
mgnify:CR=1 FL=1